MRVRCPICGKPFPALPGNIWGGTRSCRRCADKIVAQKNRLPEHEVDKLLSAKGFRRLEPYTGAKTLLVQCPDCGAPFRTQLNRIRTGATRSCGCYQKQRTSEARKTPPGEVQGRFMAKGLECVGEYNGRKEEIVVRCRRCGQTFTGKPANIWKRKKQPCACYQVKSPAWNRKDIRGKRFGMLIAVRPTEQKRHNHVVWECLCDCGETAFYTPNELKTRRSCGCLRRVCGSQRRGWTGHGEIPGRYWSNLKASAKRRDIPFRLSIEEAWTLFLEQEDRCVFSGVALPFESTYQAELTTASLDRIDSSRCYELGNVQWIHKTVNRMKVHFSAEYFLQLCRLVVRPIRDGGPSPACVLQRKHGNFKGSGNLGRDYWRSVVQGTNAGRYASARREVSLELSIEQAWNVFLAQQGRCAITGLELDFARRVRATHDEPGRRHRGSASLDRIDSTKGYLPGNVQWIHKHVNLMKWDLDEHELREWCRLVTQQRDTGKARAQRRAHH